VAEDEVAVERDRLLVVALRICVLALDEVQLRPVVVDVRVFAVLGQRQLKVCGCTRGVTLLPG